VGFGAEFRFFQNPNGIVGFLQIAHKRGLGRYGAVELDEHLLADGQFGIEGFLMTPGVIEPHEGRGQIEERETFFAADLDGRGRSKRDGFCPHRGDIGTATDLGQDCVGIGFWVAKP